MQTDGWIFMIGSWLIILALFAYSMARTMTSRQSDSKVERDPE